MRRGSIARMMLGVGLSSLALVLLRGWLGPQNRFGFLGLLGLVVLAAGITGLVTVGAVRRFFAAFGLASLVCWVSVLVSPATVLDQIRDALILPAHRWYLGERRYLGKYSSHFIPRVEEMFFVAELGEDDDLNRQFDPLSRDGTHLYGFHPELQAWLLTPMAGLAAVVGLIAAWQRPGRTNPPRVDSM